MNINCYAPITALLCFLSLAAAAPAQSQPALKEAFSDVFLIGAAVNKAQFTGKNPTQTKLITQQFSSITPEDAMKWESIHPDPDRFQFEATDRFVAFGEAHNMFIIGHTLVWHSQTPNWLFEDAQGGLASRELLLARMSNHIHTVVGRYKGRVKGWDVVNEALNDDGALRDSPWRKIIGDDFLIKAFQFAHEADPNAELYYNDYSLEKATKGRGAIELIKQLQAASIKVTGVGMQTHIGLDSPTISSLDETISAFAKLGVKVMITELDVNVLPRVTRSDSAEVSLRIEARPELNPYTNGLPDSVQQQLAKRYADLFAMLLTHRNEISRVTFWGVTDGDSWLNDWPVRGRTSYPLLFDRTGKPKPAFQAVIETTKTKISLLNPAN